MIDRETFDELAALHRREIQLHCYRMLGSVHDAEDAVQDTLLRAWRGREGFAGRGSFRAWLYRIATNACLRALERRARRRRVLPDTERPPVAFEPLGLPDRGTPWLEPFPTGDLEDIADVALGPAARYEAREATRLAFVAAIQLLPPRQRAVLLLRDVLGLSAGESADTLQVSAVAVNSSLQRARATLRAAAPEAAETLDPMDVAQRALLDRYVDAWETGDVDGFVALLANDAVWTMPPWREWYVGGEAIGAFMAWAREPERGRQARLVETRANGQPAFGYFRTEPGGSSWQPFAIQVLDVRGGTVRSVTNFVDEALFEAFGLSAASSLDGER